MEKLCKKDSQNMSNTGREMIDLLPENKYLKVRVTSPELQLNIAQKEQSPLTRSAIRNKRAGTGAAAFHVTMTRTMTGPSTNDIIAFNNVVTNIGSAQFSTSTGVFTCSHPGSHVFTWSVMVKGQHWVVTQLPQYWLIGHR
ncbi:uncharacterized protein LOC110440582 [Mizuhopecten yessoensis]|uniref:uncharacterized protein LOC110440582 n=1 Tax=Mizuhopecten yessoensis TaxID=6573 RepID=UPI000B45BF25|nr:uncharacterized protein LOC110440582 [Mizuhopecten yessoensis]